LFKPVTYSYILWDNSFKPVTYCYML